MFFDIVKHFLLVWRRFVLGEGTAPVYDFTVDINSCKSGLAAVEEFPVCDIPALDAINLPVPRAKILICKPQFLRSMLLDRVSWNDVNEERNKLKLLNKTQHPLLVADDRSTYFSLRTID